MGQQTSSVQHPKLILPVRDSDGGEKHEKPVGFQKDPTVVQKQVSGLKKVL